VTLRIFLRRLREDKGLTQAAAAEGANIPVHQLGRIESGASTIRQNDLEKLLAVYGVERSAWPEWIDRSNRSRKRAEDWAARYGAHIGNEFRQFLAIESATKILRNFEPFLVPGLLQTPEYAEETLKVLVRDPEVDIDDPSAVATAVAEQKRAALLALRLERQDRWRARQPPAEAYFIVDESVLLRQVGGAGVMLAQLTSLRDAVVDHAVALHVRRHRDGLYEHWNEAYVVFETDLGLATHNLFREYAHSDDLVRESPKNLEPAEYAASFDLLRESAPLDRTVALLDSLIASY
jgi:transcriptional regulator with XRE-family HTH domain